MKTSCLPLMEKSGPASFESSLSTDTFSYKAIPTVIDRHAIDSAMLWELRTAAIGQPHFSLHDLAKLDGRLAAHLDGLAIAQAQGWAPLVNENPVASSSEVFSLAFLMLDQLPDGDVEPLI